jgi:ABC-type amino acid transport system permease subunit
MALYSSTSSSTRSRATASVVRILAALVVAVVFPFVLGLDVEDFSRLAQWGFVRFLGLGLIATITTSLVSILLSLPLATLLALARFERRTPQAYLSGVVIEVVRALPILLVILYVNVRFTALRQIDDAINFSGIWNTLFGALFSQGGLAVVVALTIYTAVVNAELIRAGMASLDRGQFEASRALGLSYWQMMRLVVLPQTFRRVLPALIAQFTTLVKDTSLGAIIGFVELQRSAQIIYQVPGYNALAVLYVAALLYFVINYLLGKASEAIERRRGSPRNVRLQGELAGEGGGTVGAQP